MAQYRLATADPDGPVVHTDSETNVPNDPNNREWQRYRFWCDVGNAPDPYVPPPPLPKLSEDQLRRVLEGKP
jgi:hypothetical protein